MLGGRRDALDLRGGEELADDHGVVELAPNILCLLVIRSNCNNAGASTDWPLPGISIEEKRWSIILEDVVVIRVLLVIQGYLNYGLS